MRRFSAAIVFVFLLFSSAAFTQQAIPSQPSPKPDEKVRQQAQKGGAGQHAAQEPSPSGELAEASEKAAGEDEAAGFKQSASVLWIAHMTGLGPKSAYWALVGLNFVIIAVIIALFWKAKIPAMFRARTAAIRKGMEEARKASEEASRRLGEIEQRLAKLDSEIAGMRAAAETDAVAEEARIRAAAEEDKRKVIEMAEQEITAAARSARRELKAYAAKLAVSLAERRMQVDARTDEALVRSFVAQLGETDGRKEKR